MTNPKEIPPEFQNQSFTCPHCGVLTSQAWRNERQSHNKQDPHDIRKDIYTSRCYNCADDAIWLGEIMIYPLISSAPKPENNMPEPVKELYEEASLVSIHSSRAAAALLRVALEKLTEHLGETDPNLNKRIGNLRKKGVSEDVINSLDIVRITANSGGAHAGIIDLTGADGADIVNRLFWLVNYIIEKSINDPAKIKQMFQALPEAKRKGAEDRDKPKDKT